MIEIITEVQLKKLAKIFKITGRTFQSIAAEVGIKYIPDHAVDLTKNEAKLIIKYFRNFIK